MEELLIELQEIFIKGGVSERIKYIRKFRNLTIKQAADKCITTEKCWSDWENGKAIPRRSNKKLIALTLNVSQEIIFGKPQVYSFNNKEEMPS